MAAWPLHKLNRGAAVLLAGTALAAAWMLYPYFAEPPAPVLRPPRQAAVTPAAAADNRMPKGFGQPSVICDPFQTPSAVLPSAAASKRPVPVQAIPYRVTGIAFGGQGAAAILESHEGSRSYRIGDYAGQYQVCAITPDSVLIVGANESHQLYLKRGI